MWNCSAPSSLLMPFSDDYVKCESSSSPAGTAGFDKILTAAADYGHLRHHLPPFQSLQTPSHFATRTSEGYFGIGDGSIYSGGDVRPSLMHFGFTQPDSSPTAATMHMLTWTAEGSEPMVGDGSSSNKRLKTRSTATTTTAQGPQRRLQGSAKPRNHAPKAPCKRSQKLGDKITALQQLVSPYGKTDTASVLHEAAACIRSLHEQIQILAAPLPCVGSSPSSPDTGEEPTTSLRRQGLCVAPLSAAMASLVSDSTRGHGHGHSRADTGGAASFFGAL